MTDVLTTIRIPPSLIKELQALVREQHYSDMSELIRSVLRSKYEEAKHAKAAAVGDAIVRDLKRSTLRKSESRLQEELRRIQERLREELR